MLASVAFVFPGQGSQVVGMAADLCEHFAVARACVAEADEALGFALSRLMREGPEATLRQTAHAQPAILVASIAAYRALDLRPAVVAGHSLGEYSALVAAGALSLRDAVRLVHRRGQYMQEAVPDGTGAMIALIGLDAAAVAAAIAAEGDRVDIANLNAPGQIVIAGLRDDVTRVAARSGARQAIPLAVSAPFHCRLMRPAEARLRVDLDSAAIADPLIAFYNNVDAARVTTAAAVRDGLIRQVSRPVQWAPLVQRMIADEGIRTVVEVGPGTVLSGLVRRIDRTVGRLSASDTASIASVREALAG